MNSSTLTLATGVVIAAGAVYAYKSGLTFSDVLDKFSENKEKFQTIVENLVAKGYEILKRLLKTLNDIINEFKNKYINTKKECQ